MSLLFANSLLNDALALIGALMCLYYFAKCSWGLLVGARAYILPKFWRTDLTSYGDWAVVTGATAGIGKAYAHELARRGLNVVLISRSLERLRATAEEIEQQQGKKTKIIQADFTSGAEIYGPIEAALKDLNIGILVNNVGKTYTMLPCYFLDVPNVDKEILDIMNCNALSVLMMTRIVLPHMLERKKGVIINISSEAGTHPHPLLTMYSATKCVLPLLVSTNLTRLETSIFVKQADDYVREALNTVGIREQTNGCLAHAVQHFVIEMLCPEWLRLTQMSMKNLKRSCEKRRLLLEKYKMT
ncbi:very-long-chain 3-oxoacyl-CoA reductase-B-like isoform X2 [Heptranchias perlo]|uniref:very-long-chain 3-oxoacyl-CoA reductase-B-like isoform X2 n=1 Tax=Heptranchias perlo TaxID=212740 RepID=UPI0035596AF2